MKKILAVVGVAVVAGAAIWGVTKMQSGSGDASIVASEPKLRQITQTQYLNTVAQIFGPDVTVRVRFAPVNRIDGLVGVGVSSAVMTTGALDPLASTARSIAEQVVDPAHRQFLIGCKPENVKAADDVCARKFFTKVGRLIYRRPLTTAEVEQYVKLANGAIGPAGDFYAGVAFSLTGMLMSPQFLYVRDMVESDPDHKGAARLEAYSKASRLSFILWDGAPDDELLKAAAQGDLHKAAGLRRQVDRMLESPLYAKGVRAFFNDFFVLEAFDNLAKDSTIYPAFSLQAVEEAREQVLRTVVDHLVTRQADYRDLFTTRHTFVTSQLGTLYNMPVDLGSQGWMPFEFPADDPRAGILTQIGFLAQYAHPGRSSSTKRGRAIREVLLCQKVPDPPPDVDFSKFEDPSNPLPTARLRLEAHRKDPTCAGCHALMDPLGVGLENFDGAGQFRTTEKGTPIDPSGELDGMQFTDAVSLGKAVRDNAALKSCVVNRLYAYSVGRKVMTEEKPVLTQLETALDKKGYKFDEMLRLIVLDKSFFAVRLPEDTAPTNTAAIGGSNAN